MAILINDACINCGACEPECPNNAIYGPAESWNFAEGTTLKTIETEDGQEIDASQMQEPLSDEFFFIVAEKCTECHEDHEEPQCDAVCPINNCCVPDPDYVETEEELSLKRAWLQG